MTLATRTEKIANDWKSSDYYERVEQTVHQFWAIEGKFRPLFERLDLEHVLELACGHGRHVDHYIERASRVTLVDVNKENVEFCQNRFSDKKIRFVVNSGNDLGAVRENSLTSIFCYDAMVHFELLDIFAYLQEFHRVLKVGGQALLHHSNFTGNPTKNYNENPHWRNFMSAEIMRYLASRAELEVLEQRVTDWGGRRKHFQLDCISLIRKP